MIWCRGWHDHEISCVFWYPWKQILETNKTWLITKCDISASYIKPTEFPYWLYEKWKRKHKWMYKWMALVMWPRIFALSRIQRSESSDTKFLQKFPQCSSEAPAQLEGCYIWIFNLPIFCFCLFCILQGEQMKSGPLYDI